MTNMRQKTTEQKRHRRTRLKRAMAPLLKKFNCTQMELAGHCDAMVRHSAELLQTNNILKEEREFLKERIKQLEEKIEDMKAEYSEMNDR